MGLMLMTFSMDELEKISKDFEASDYQEWRLCFIEADCVDRKALVNYQNRTIFFPSAFREEVLKHLRNRGFACLVSEQLYSTFFTAQEIEQLRKVK